MSFAVVLFAGLVVPQGLASAPPGNITRGIYAPPGPLISANAWGRCGVGFEYTEEAPHGGRACIKCVNAGDLKLGAGVGQDVTIGQTTPAPLKLSGWSKAVGVPSPGDSKTWNYSLYLDLRYADGTSWYMQIAPFSYGTHDWEYAETILQPEKPVAKVAFWAFLRERPGTVYFDDLFLGSPDGPNLLKNPGFEPEDRVDTKARDTVFATFADLNANAYHTYLSGDPAFWQGTDGKGNLEVREGLAAAKQAGLGVWVTTGGPPTPALKDAQDPNFPQLDCVNGWWGKAWTEGIALAAAYDFAGISLVPDEYNWFYAGYEESYGKHPDPAVVEYYKNLPAMCQCPVCQKLYQDRFGAPLPKLAKGETFPEQTQAYRDYLRLRYDSTTSWLARSAAAVHAANPAIRADSLLCVTPICSDFWWGPGIAWDRLDETGVDFPTTDPYIQLHNYLGDSTHWYVTETAAHLTAATPKRQCGIVLEASRILPEYRELDPVEIYGSALSAVAHGAKEIAWWHYSNLIDEAPATARPEVSRACVRGVHELLKQADPWLADLKPEPTVALLYSRASDDGWRFYSEPQPAAWLGRAEKDARYSAIAQKEVLYALLRRGVPTDLYYLESATEEELAKYKVIVVPFPLAISDGQAAMLAALANRGQTVMVMSELGRLDENLARRDKPALAGLVKEERLAFVAGAFGYELPLNRDNQKRTRTERIQPDPLNLEQSGQFLEILDLLCGGTAAVVADFSNERDIEATALTNGAGDTVVLAINWSNEPAEVKLLVPRVGFGVLQGYGLTPDGMVRERREQARGGVCTVTLQGQEACLWRGVQ